MRKTQVTGLHMGACRDVRTISQGSARRVWIGAGGWYNRWRLSAGARGRTLDAFQHIDKMAGVKQFDRKEVLANAQAVFWSRGYEATSIQDLVDATGINRGSLYGTFGDKLGLFLAVIDHYLETIATPMMAELANPDPRAAIAGMFAALIRRNSDPAFPRGCLITNTSLECPVSGDTIARKIAEAMGQQETAIYRVLHRAQSAGSLAASRDARALARFFLGVAQGLNVVNKAVADPEILRDMVRIAMSVWDTGPTTSTGSRGSRRPSCARN
jgi:TetR/AcrR family transcriptional repressor of nem operon